VSGAQVVRSIIFPPVYKVSGAAVSPQSSKKLSTTS
jgi:hypothetical protein